MGPAPGRGRRREIFSGGSAPAETVNPVAVEAMDEVGIDISGAQPARWTEEIVERVDAVVSMGCGDRCPVIPGEALPRLDPDGPRR